MHLHDPLIQRNQVGNSSGTGPHLRAALLNGTQRHRPSVSRGAVGCRPRLGHSPESHKNRIGFKNKCICIIQGVLQRQQLRNNPNFISNERTTGVSRFHNNVPAQRKLVKRSSQTYCHAQLGRSVSSGGGSDAAKDHRSECRKSQPKVQQYCSVFKRPGVKGPRTRGGQVS
jgi:hypothetical protein